MGRQNPGLIQTKFQRPALGRDILPRPHLINRLNRGCDRNLTLISAPAGYGKSILASAWMETIEWPVAWLSLDKQENDLRTFLLYFISAIQTIFPDSFPETQDLLLGAELPPADYLASSLVNETSYFSTAFTLVLDDYHHISNQHVQHVIATLIHYQSPLVHLVIITRQDPMLDLFNLRAKSLITELRLNDLRFNPEEIQQFCTQKLGKPLTMDNLAQLTERTEGWAAGLRLACLAMRPLDDYAEFLQNLLGTNQFIMGYLIEEVLNRQSPALQLFLLCTSILNRFCPPLADALISAIPELIIQPIPAAEDLLEQIKQANLFLISLDQEGFWFRYHHLFQELLNYRLQKRMTSDQIAALHNAAAGWFAEEGDIDEALDSYLKAGNVEDAVLLVSGQRFTLLNETSWPKLYQYFQRFSLEDVGQYPDLLLIKMWLLYHQTSYHELLPILLKLDQLLPHTSFSPNDVRRIQGEMSTLYALLAYLHVEPDEAVAHAQFAIENTPPDLWIVRSLARTVLAGSRQMNGDLGGAYAAIYVGLTEEREQSNHFKSTLIQGISSVAWVAADMQRVMQTGRQNIQLSHHSPNPQIQGMGRYHLGSALYQTNELSSAEAQFAIVYSQPYLNYGEYFVYSVIGLALTYMAQDRFQDAEQLVKELLDYLLHTSNLFLLPVVHAFQAEMSLRNHNLPAASQWAHQFQEPPPPVPIYQLYAPHLTLAKIWLAQNTPASRQLVTNFLSSLQTFYQSIHNTNMLLQVLAVRALLHDQAGEESMAWEHLQEALTLARPGRMIRAFVDLGQPMAQLLTRFTPADADLCDYVTDILAAFTTPSTMPMVSDGQLFENLTNREIDILNLLVDRMANKEIAQELFISENTVRYHLKNIYSKLDVHNRRQAALRAHELGIIVPQ